MPTAACRVRFSHPGRGRRLLLAALAAFLVLPGRVEVPAEQALVLLGRTRPEHPEQSPVRGLMALKSGFLANVRFFGDYSSSPSQDYPPHPQLATREGDERQTAEKLDRLGERASSKERELGWEAQDTGPLAYPFLSVRFRFGGDPCFAWDFLDGHFALRPLPRPSKDDWT